MSTVEVEVGTRLPARTIHVDRERLRAYADASGDQNPIHQDEQVARAVGLPDVIAHGMWTMGAAVQVVSEWIGDPTRVVSYTTRFTNPVVVPAGTGADVEVSGTVTKVDADSGRATVELTVVSGGTKVLGRTLAVVRL